MPNYNIIDIADNGNPHYYYDSTAGEPYTRYTNIGTTPPPPPNGPNGGGPTRLAGLKRLLAKLKAKNINIPKLANIGMLGYQGVNIAKDANNMTGAIQDTDEYLKQIKALAFSNPLGFQNLNPEQAKLLRQIKNGTYNSNRIGNNIQGGLSGFLSGIPMTALSTLGGYLIGGAPGALIQAGGGISRNVMKGIGNAQYDPKLAGLYNALQQADADYRSMKRPNVYGAGLQNRYANQLY